MALALQEFEDTTTPFGNDAAKALDPRCEGEFEVETVTDWEKAAVDSWHKRNPDPEPGKRPYVVYRGEG